MSMAVYSSALHTSVYQTNVGVPAELAGQAPPVAAQQRPVQPRNPWSNSACESQKIVS